jgi:MFS family permease
LLIGAVLGAEGLVALVVPALVGSLSDRTHSRFGSRRPYLLGSVPFTVVTLVALPFAGSIGATAGILVVFFVAYYVYETPYRAMYAERVTDEQMGRAVGVQHLARGAAIGLALVLGGVLLQLGHPLPFLVSAAVACAGGGALFWLTEPRTAQERADWRAPIRILRGEPDVRRFLICNTAWETTFAGMRTFVVLYVVRGLHQPLYVSSIVLGTVAAGYLVAAAGVGRLGDRFGVARVIAAASVVYGLGLVAGVLPSSWHWAYLAPVFVVAIAAGAVMTLAWALLYKLMPAEDRGAASGLGTTTKGLGLLLGPTLTGAAIDLCKPVLSSTAGYAAMWPTLAVPVLVVLPLVLSLAAAESRRAGSRAESDPSRDSGHASAA